MNPSVKQLLDSSGFNLKYLTEEQRSDFDVVMAAVKQNGCALKYASKALRGNETIVMEATKKSAYALNYASDDLQYDIRFIRLAVARYDLESAELAIVRNGASH